VRARESESERDESAEQDVGELTHRRGLEEVLAEVEAQADVGHDRAERSVYGAGEPGVRVDVAEEYPDEAGDLRHAHDRDHDAPDDEDRDVPGEAPDDAPEEQREIPAAPLPAHGEKGVATMLVAVHPERIGRLTAQSPPCVAELFALAHLSQ